ncbi:MAG: FAD-dependent oxidoreductase [Acidimicrobiia bacterium]|jgi:NADPH-dependent glutamate synthase beta subunit-like oxidoreductase/ferredoxin
MSDRFRPISMEQLTAWVFTELEQKQAIFGIPRSAFFVPGQDDRFRIEKYGRTLETPFGVAAGPHTQMAQNIVVAWLVGARFIELKTVQTLDELDVNKPCIDLQDEGYNVEWSQELKVYESFDEYLRAWVLIHALHHALGFPGDAPGIIFNMSVGYNLEGILRPNVQWYLDVMDDASDYLPAYVDIVAAHYPAVRDLEIPAQLSDTITLSTMHGCPPDEIERISEYLLSERGLHTSVKCNPTLLGAERVRRIVHDDLGFTDIPIPDEAFGHDLEYRDAVPMFHNLRRVADSHGLTFGLKLTNTLEVENFRPVFDRDETMYMSGRSLHAVTTNLAQRLVEEFRGGLLLSFAGGADCFNVADLLRSGMKTVTVCSDLLKSGGYLRMLQYMEKLDEELDAVGAADLTDFTCKTAILQGTFAGFASLLYTTVLTESGVALTRDACQALADRLRTTPPAGRAVDVIAAWATDAGLDPEQVDAVAAAALRVLARLNLRQYANAVRADWRLRKDSFRTDRSKTPRELDLFDCVQAPCVDECPVDQAVPQYMAAVRERDFARAVEITRADNPLPSILGHVCDHLCENTCIRTHLDQPLAIRDMKRFIMSREDEPPLREQAAPIGAKVAVIGAGPAGLAAAEELALAGIEVTVFEAYPYPGGMVGGAIPAYRLPQAQIDQDVDVLRRLGVEIRYGQKAGVDVTLEGLRRDGYRAVFVAVGAQLAKRLGIEGEDSDGVMDALHFLRSVREEQPVAIGARVGVIGAGDTAMDCARSALRVGAEDVAIIYRRTVDQMPADREEIRACLEEGIRIVELAAPDALHVEEGRLAGLVCTRTEYRGDRDPSGRKIPHDVPDSDFEIPLDTLILAISQHSVLDFFGDEEPALTPRGYLAVDPVTFETSIPGVYAGGDVAGAGPSSIVKAAADGKAVAAAIAAAVGEAGPAPAGEWIDVDLPSLFVRRARREYRVPVKHTPLSVRNDFGETILTYTEEEAVAEAGRCLDCHTICSLCVGVCPNLALMTYQTEPFAAELPSLSVKDGTIVAGEASPFRVDQRPQIAVLTDFCNECGNCVTACPTSGRPYVDKPRLYLDRDEFLAQKENAFMVTRDGEAATVEARWDGETHRLVWDGAVEYESPSFRATMDPATLALQEATPAPGAVDGEALSLRQAATMFTVLKGLRDSMPQVPAAVVEGAGAVTRIAHPGYAE